MLLPYPLTGFVNAQIHTLSPSSTTYLVCSIASGAEFVFPPVSAPPLCTYTPTPQQDSVSRPPTTLRIAPHHLAIIQNHPRSESYKFRQQLEYGYPHLRGSEHIPTSRFNPNMRKSGMSRHRRRQQPASGGLTTQPTDQ